MKNYSQIPESLLDDFVRQLKNRISPSITLLRQIGTLASSYGYGTTLKKDQETLYKQLARERDFLLEIENSSEKNATRFIEYICICTEEFKEFALLDDMILRYIANLKSSYREHKRFAPEVRKMIEGLLDPIMPKHQGYRGESARPITLRICGEATYDQVLKSLQQRLKRVGRERNPASRKLSIVEVATELFRSKKRTVQSSKLDAFARKHISSPANKIALKLVSLLLNCKSSALHKALHSKRSLK